MPAPRNARAIIFNFRGDGVVMKIAEFIALLSIENKVILNF